MSCYACVERHVDNECNDLNQTQTHGESSKTDLLVTNGCSGPSSANVQHCFSSQSMTVNHNNKTFFIEKTVQGCIITLLIVMLEPDAEGLTQQQAQYAYLGSVFALLTLKLTRTDSTCTVLLYSFVSQEIYMFIKMQEPALKHMHCGVGF